MKKFILMFLIGTLLITSVTSCRTYKLAKTGNGCEDVRKYGKPFKS